jgi:hypothetical protein
MPEPPCLEGVHWRVLKNPKGAPNQIRELEKFLQNRLDPETCEYEYAGRPKFPGAKRVQFNRPIQSTTVRHKLVFCECIDWATSKSEADLAWYQIPKENHPLPCLPSAQRERQASFLHFPIFCRSVLRICSKPTLKATG